jgi:hypothetical protein
MERTLEITEKPATRESSNILSLAVAMGFITFLLTGDLPGGLTSVQGYLVGFFAVIFPYVSLALIESRRSQSRTSRTLRLNAPSDISITQTENEKGVAIQIYVSKASIRSYSQGVDK